MAHTTHEIVSRSGVLVTVNMDFSCLSRTSEEAKREFLEAVEAQRRARLNPRPEASVADLSLGSFRSEGVFHPEAVIRVGGSSLISGEILWGLLERCGFGDFLDEIASRPDRTYLVRFRATVQSGTCREISAEDFSRVGIPLTPVPQA
jgi:hypothetical protein